MCEGINVLSHLNSATLNYFPVPITILRQVRRSSEEARSYPVVYLGTDGSSSAKCSCGDFGMSNIRRKRNLSDRRGWKLEQRASESFRGEPAEKSPGPRTNWVEGKRFGTPLL